MRKRTRGGEELIVESGQNGLPPRLILRKIWEIVYTNIIMINDVAFLGLAIVLISFLGVIESSACQDIFLAFRLDFNSSRGLSTRGFRWPDIPVSRLYILLGNNGNKLNQALADFYITKMTETYLIPT